MQSLDRKLVHARLGIFSLTPSHHYTHTHRHTHTCAHTHTHTHTHTVTLLTVIFFQCVCVYCVPGCVSDGGKKKKGEVKTEAWWQSPVCLKVCVFMCLSVFVWTTLPQNKKNNNSGTKKPILCQELFFSSSSFFLLYYSFFGDFPPIEMMSVRRSVKSSTCPSQVQGRTASCSA